MDNVQVAIKVHGAPAVQKAASEWMGGQPGALDDMGIACTSMSQAWHIMGVANDQMDDAERAIDQAQATAELDARANKNNG